MAYILCDLIVLAHAVKSQGKHAPTSLSHIYRVAAAKKSGDGVLNIFVEGAVDRTVAEYACVSKYNTQYEKIESSSAWMQLPLRADSSQAILARKGSCSSPGTAGRPISKLASTMR